VQYGQVSDLLETPQSQPKIFELQLEILFEDHFMAAIHKPAGFSVSGNAYKTIYNSLPYNLKKSSEPDALPWPTPVHRLDNQTSGILLIAKTKTAQIALGNQLENHTIQKKYCAVVIGKVLSKGKIKTPIEDKTAQTDFEVVTVVNSLRFEHLSLLNVFPKTGRTHQIRAHLKHIGHTLFNDERYGGDIILKGTTFTKYKQFVENCFKTLPRQGLHAKTLGFQHPITKEFLQFNSEMPEDMQLCLEKWRSYTINQKE
jgi:RluA family pseudouridine synthase